ncbi:E3 SUMO-protein ligase RanBP2, partial [Coemansia sp. RSA 2599]
TEISSKKVESKGETKAIKVQSLFANAPETPAAFKPSSSLLASASASKPSLSKHEIRETSKPATGQPSLATESATPVRTPRETALALGEAQLPKYAFDLPVAKLGSSATADNVKRTVVSLSTSQLPVFAFSIETSAAPFLSEPASKPSLKADAGSKTATSSWADSGFKIPGLKDGEWKCGVCDITNPKNVNQCRACESPKPNSNPSSQPAPAKPSVTSSWADSGFKMPGLKDGEWKCGVCDITNPRNVNQCRACESPKPAPKPSAPQPVPAQAPAASSWADSGFKMPGLKDGEWKCGVCDITNPKGVNQCRACESPKPSSSQPTPVQVPVASSWADSGFKMPGLKDGEWKCGVCDITNPKNVNQCRACESLKPASASANALPSSSAAAKTSADLPPSNSAKLKASSLATDQLPTFTFELDVAKKPTAPAAAAAPNLWAESGFKVPALKDGEWKCTLCMITNPASTSACRACETPK